MLIPVAQPRDGRGKPGPKGLDFDVADLERIHLRLCDGLTGEQVAEEMGMPARTFYRRLERAGKQIVVTARGLRDIAPAADT